MEAGMVLEKQSATSDSKKIKPHWGCYVLLKPQILSQMTHFLQQGHTSPVTKHSSLRGYVGHYQSHCYTVLLNKYFFSRTFSKLKYICLLSVKPISPLWRQKGGALTTYTAAIAIVYVWELVLAASVVNMAQPKVTWPRSLSWGSAKMSWIYGGFSWLRIDIEGLIPLWEAPSLGR